MEGGKAGVNILFMNAQSVCNKIDELRAMVAGEKPDIIAICETWTNDTMGDSIFGIEGYDIASRCDRNDTVGGRGGGLLVYNRKEMCVWKISVDSGFNQGVTVRVRCGNEDLNVHSVYRSPNSTRDNDMMLNHWVSSMRGSNIIIGDLNYPDIDWRAETSGSRGRGFLEAAVDRGMEQHVLGPTHISGNTLDLILCDQEGIINEVRMLGRLGKSDHEMVAFNAAIEPRRRKKIGSMLNHRRANYAGMRTDLESETWEGVRGTDVNAMWFSTKNRIHDLIEKFTPEKRPRKGDDPPWMNNDIRKAIATKRQAWKKWKESGRECDANAYRQREKETKKKIKSRKNAWERRIVENRKTNPKLFYSQISRAKKNRDKVAPLYDSERRIVVDPKDQARVLNSQYAKVFTRCTDEPPPPRQRTDTRLSEIPISREKVIAAIDSLKEEAAPGPDEIPPKIYKELKEELAVPLVKLFSASLETGKIPDEWRDSIITPIYKQKGSRSEPENYRPVSLTNVAGKILEKIVKNELMSYIENNKLMSNSQHGFRSGRSVQTNLISFLNTTTRWLDEGRSFDVIYLDFAKAFDKVCHRRLIVKLQEWGIIGEVLEWLRDWLQGRRQRVRVEGEWSEWEDVISSVLQGSVLGGLLFIIFIDDIDEAVANGTSPSTEEKFADDTKIARITETEADVQDMQETINNLSRWAKTWAMDFNADKCKVMHFGNRNLGAKYVMNGIELGEISEEKDLGVKIANTMKPSNQCAAAAKSAHFALSQIQRSFHFRRKRDLVPLYKTFVRPKLEFSVAAWSPWTEADIKSMERVQERLVRLLSDVRGESYEEKLKDAGLTTLRERRRRGDAIEAYKTLEQINKVDATKWFRVIGEEARPLRSNTEMEGGNEKRKNVLEVERARLEIRKNFFVVRAAMTWNSLPETVKAAKTINGFKNAYDAWTQKQPENNNMLDAAEDEEQHLSSNASQA